MSNPWLTIPEADYLGHMDHPTVSQRTVLNGLLGDVLKDTRPEAILVIGCSTGNGFEHIDPSVTRRVTCVDINGAYLERLAPSVVAIDPHCADIMACEFDRESFDLIHAALVLEYVDWPVLIPRLSQWLESRGTLSVVLQRPSASTAAVTPTPFTSLRALEAIFHFVNVEELRRAGDAAGLVIVHQHIEPLPSDKAFEAVRFQRSL